VEAPDTRHTPSYFGEVVVEILYSTHDEFRAIITERPEGIFHVRKEKWDLSDWDIIRKGYWIPQDRGTTFTDRIETAQALAREKLQATSDGINSESK
jgi:hypothetical protein